MYFVVDVVVPVVVVPVEVELVAPTVADIAPQMLFEEHITITEQPLATPEMVRLEPLMLV